MLHPYLTRANEPEDTRTPEASLEEAVSLIAAIEIDVVGAELAPMRATKPATYIPTGRLKSLKEAVEADTFDLLVVNTDLSPIQHRNLERAIGCKVIDRTALILEIFGARARTREGELQVTLAHLTYQKSRLVRSWTHLERQRGGGGFMGGPGETQIEADRRLIDDRIARLKAKLEDVRRTRTEHRKSRKKAPHPVVALVGYTNAGKSTLFNRLTGASVHAEDLLFATLDPTLRSIELLPRKKVILSDTVGFIADLPTQLIAAFRATLEEVLEADIILHVRDIAHNDTALQARDVYEVLKELGVDPEAQDAIPIIEVWNKTDLLCAEQDRYWQSIAERLVPPPLMISAQKGSGIEPLRHAVIDMLSSDDYVVQLWVPFEEGKLSAYIRAHGDILKEVVIEQGIAFTFSIDPIQWGRVEKTSKP